MVEVAFLTFVGVLCRTTGGALPPLHDIIQSENNNPKYMIKLNISKSKYDFNTIK